MQSMDAATREEFAALRRRAYGPNADIVDDPVALARLRELEERHDRGSTPATAARMAEAESLFGPRASRPESSVPPAAQAPSALDIAVSSAEPQRAEAHARATPTPPRIGRALLIGWAASIVAVAIVVGALVFGLASLRPVSAVTGARQVASLDEPITDLPTGGVDVDSHAGDDGLSLPRTRHRPLRRWCSRRHAGVHSCGLGVFVVG